MDFTNLEKDLLIFLEKNLKATGRKNFILGVSGGLDSAVVSVLCKKVAPTYAKIMPTNSSNKANLDDAINHCKKFDINYEICSIDNLIKTYEKIFLNKKISTHRIGNLSARIRMMVLYDLSEELDAVVVGTSNLSELMLGYGTVFGDLACAFNPIGEIFKTEIFEFAKFLKIDEKIISKKPSADLFEGQSDEQDLGYDYETLDKVLKKIYDDGLNFKELCDIFDESLAKFITSKIEQNSFKRRMPKIANIRKSSANTIF